MSAVLVPGREWAEGDPMPSPLATYQKLFVANGFDVKVGYSESFEEGGEYGESAQKAGEKKPDKHIKLVWIDAKTERHLCTVTYQYTNDNPTPVCNMRSWDLRLEKLSDAELKQRIKNADTLH